MHFFKSSSSNHQSTRTRSQVELQIIRDNNMALAFHIERHSTSSELIRDSIIGLSDGLTVPFALTAGLSSLGSPRIVILGGLAELFSGAISMGLGAYLASITEKKHDDVEEERERREVDEKPEAEEAEIYDILNEYGVTQDAARPLVEALEGNKDNWVKFMMDFELQLSKPSPSKARIEGLVMGISCFVGGILPMIPYFAIRTVNHALFVSIGVTVVILLIFGYAKAIITGTTQKDAYWSACQTLLVGVLAAAVSYGIVRGIESASYV